jgi:hypothetical protein
MRFSLPSIKSLNELHEILATRKDPGNDNASRADAFLLYTKGKYWSYGRKSGPNKVRVCGIKDVSKIWFLEFLKFLRQRCITLKGMEQDTARVVLFEKIIAAIEILYCSPDSPDSRAPKRQKTGPSAQV